MTTLFVILTVVFIIIACVLFLNILSCKKKLKADDKLFRIVFEEAPIGVAIIRNERENCHINPTFCEILGRTEDELKTIEMEDITHPDDVQEDVAFFEKLQSGEINGYEMVKRYLKKDGSYTWVHMIISGFREYGENNSEHLCIIEDINQHIQDVEALSESERSKSVLISHLPGMAYRCIYDGNWKMQFLSDGCLKLTGYNPESILYNYELSYDQIIAPEYRAEIWRQWGAVLEHKAQLNAEYEIITASGNRKWVTDAGQGIFDENDEIIALEGIVIDISESKIRLEQIIHMSSHDFMTGLFNRKYYEMAKNELDTEANLPISIIVADINGLRLINDALGHSQGDMFITKTAEIMNGSIRARDILCRTGGDDFSIFMPQTDDEEAKATLYAIKDSVDQYNKSVFAPACKLNLSIGYGTKGIKEQDINVTEKVAQDFMMKRKLLERESYHNSILSTIMATMYTKSQETEEHTERIAELTKFIGTKMGLAEKNIADLQIFSMLHDIGKVGIDDRILNKPGKLSDEEWQIMKRHPELGHRIVMTNPDLSSIAEYILSHHERWDGAGYPRGLKGEEIPLLSRILAVADAYDAMTEDRVYRKAMDKDSALKELVKNSGTQFDPEIVSIFLKYMDEA